MYAHELYEAGKPQVVVTYPGRFQPWHQGHAGVFSQLQKKFGIENVFILTSNDQSGAKSPFNFSDKYQLITKTGVPGDRIIETNQMYKLPEGFDPASTIFITAVGAPDKDRLNPDTFTKRDQKDKEGNVTKPTGSPSYYRTWGADKNPLTSDQHGYVIVIPEIQKQITINGKNYDVSHGTECRNLWNQVRDNPEAANEFLQGLYGRATPELAAIFNKIPTAVSEDIGQTDSNYSSSPISGARVFHEFAPTPEREEGGGSRFIPWQEFVKGVAHLLKDNFTLHMSAQPKQVKARFVPIDPMEYGPSQLYAYNDPRLTHDKQQRGVGIQGAMQVGEYFQGHDGKLLTGFKSKDLDSGKYIEFTLANIPRVAAVIASNTVGALKQNAVNESYEYRAPGAGRVQTSRVLNKMKPVSKFVWKKPAQIGGSYSESDLAAKGFKKSKYNSWGGTDAMWNSLAGLDESADYHSKIQEVFKRRLGIVDEVAMNPKAFAQSITQGQDKGVLVGFEFEVLMPAATVDRPAVEPNSVQYDPNNETWIDGKTVADLLNRLQPPVLPIRSAQNWAKILDDLFKNKNSVASQLGESSIWDSYKKWVDGQISPLINGLAKKAIIKDLYNILENPLPRDTLYVPQSYRDRSDESGLPANATVRDLFVHLLASKGINVNGPRLTARTITDEQIEAIVLAAEQVYYRTSHPVDRMFSKLSNERSIVRGSLTNQYVVPSIDAWEEYNEASRQPIESFARFCQEVYGSAELKTLLKTKWAFKGRTNNATPVLKEKLWYYLTPGAAAPQSLQVRSSSTSRYPDYMKGANFLKEKLAPVFGQNMTVFRGYHQESKRLDRWYIEPDGSLRPDDGDYSAEIVSPPLPAATAMDALKTFYQQAQSLNLYTNNSTGLHINVSIPDKLDVLKLALFVGDQHVLKTFGRENNSYARSVLKNLQTSGRVGQVAATPQPTKDMVKELQAIAKDISNDHFATVNFNGKYVSFRHAGGDYLNKMNDIINTVGRFIRAMIIAADPNAYRNEYLAKLTKLIAPATKTRGPVVGQDKLNEILKSGIPGYYMDIAIRPGNYNGQDLLRAITGTYNIPVFIDLRPDPSARQRMLSSPGFGTPTKEHMTNANDSVFFKAFIAPQDLNALSTMERVQDADPQAEGIYDDRRNRMAVCVRRPVKIGRDNPLFIKSYTALRNKTVAGPKGVLPESVNEDCSATAQRAGELALIYMQSRNLQSLMDVDEYIAKKLKSEGLSEGWREKVGAGLTAAAMAAGAGANTPKVPVDKAVQQATAVYNINKAVKKHKEKEAEKPKADEKQVKEQGVAEEAAGVGVVAKNKKMAKDPRYSMSLTKDVRPNTLKNSLRAFRLSETGHSITEEGMMTMIKEFLPLAMKELKLKKVPHIVLQAHVESQDGQATFGRFVNEEEKIYLGIADRHPVDILRTLAHELVHFKQYEQGKMYPGAGETGSPIENQAHWVAGIIMRHFNKKYPKAIKSKPLEL